MIFSFLLPNFVYLHTFVCFSSHFYLLFPLKQISTLVLGEHEGGSIKAQSLSAVVAAKSLGEDNSISMLLAGSGPSVQEAAKYAASCHPSISQVALLP